MKYYSIVFGSGDPRTVAGMSPTFLIFVNMTTGATVAPPSISESLTSSGIYQFQWGTTLPIAFLADAATTSPGAVGRYVTGQIDPADRGDEYGTSLIALGTTAVAIGTTHIGQGVTIIAIGTSHIAQGVTLTAIGTSLMAYGSTTIAIGTSHIAQGVTLTAIGTSILAQGVSLLAQGVTIYTLEQAIGTSLSAIGATLNAIGTSFSVSALAIGTTASSFGTSSADPVDLFGYMKRVLENLEGDSQFTKLSGVWNIYNRGSTTLLRAKTVANSASMVTKT